MRKSSFLVPFLVLSTMVPGVLAGGFYDEPYLFRFALALDRQSNYASTLGRQASMAFPDGSSVNPAGDDWVAHPQTHVTATLTNVNAWSDTNHWLLATAFTINIQVPEAGTWSLAYARTDTINQDVRDGFDNELRSNEFFLGYSKKINDRVSLGGQLRVTDAVITEQSTLPLGLLGPQPTSQETDLVEATFAFGVMLSLDDQWTAGVSIGAGWGGAETKLRNLSNPPIPAGLVSVTTDDDVRVWSVRGGLGYAMSNAVGLYADLHYGYAESNRAGSADIGRFSFGVELKPSKIFHARFGATVDTVEQVSFSAGASFLGIRGVPIEIGYQYNAAPEVRPEYGNFHLLSISIVIPF